MERGNIFWPLCDSLKLCGWHSSLCSDRADFNRVWSIKSGAQSTPQSPQCCLCLSSSTSLGSVSPLRVVLVEAAGAGQGENAQSHFSHASGWKHTAGTWYPCFSGNEAVVFHWAVITRTHATEIIKWREGNWCALTGTPVRCWLC